MEKRTTNLKREKIEKMIGFDDSAGVHHDIRVTNHIKFTIDHVSHEIVISSKTKATTLIGCKVSSLLSFISYDPHMRAELEWWINNWSNAIRGNAVHTKIDRFGDILYAKMRFNFHVGYATIDMSVESNEFIKFTCLNYRDMPNRFSTVEFFYMISILLNGRPDITLIDLTKRSYSKNGFFYVQSN